MRLDQNDILGPPHMWVPNKSDVQLWSRMNSRAQHCPDFPKSFKDMPYRTWRLHMVHWIWNMREAVVCESLLGSKLLAALKDGAGGVYEAAIQVDPRVLGHGGRPRFG